MKAIMDLHTHTLAAGHAYSTLLENIDAALAMGLQYLGMSEHGPTSPGGPHNFFFSNYKVIPRIYDREENTGRVIPKPDGSLRLLCGVEANICSTNGELDLEERYLQKMDYALASIHPFAFTAGSRKENTLASVRAFHHIGAGGKQGIHFEYGFISVAFKRDIRFQRNGRHHAIGSCGDIHRPTFGAGVDGVLYRNGATALVVIDIANLTFRSRYRDNRTCIACYSQYPSANNSAERSSQQFFHTKNPFHLQINPLRPHRFIHGTDVFERCTGRKVIGIPQDKPMAYILNGRKDTPGFPDHVFLAAGQQQTGTGTSLNADIRSQFEQNFSVIKGISRIKRRDVQMFFKKTEVTGGVPA